MTRHTPPTRHLLARPSHLLGVVLTGALFLAGALLLADWLRSRDAAFAPQAVPQAPRAIVEPATDPRIEPFLGGGVLWSPPRPDRFGHSPALFVVGHDRRGPKEVFAQMLGGGWDDEARKAVIQAGPSAAVALRAQATVGVMPSGAFLVRLAPDLDAARAGRLVTEPGAVTLAFPTRVGWDYVTWAFPEGLDLDGLPASMQAPPESLRGLEGAADRVLDPVLALGASKAGPQTVLCRARGKPADAVRDVAQRLERLGWLRRYAADRDEGTRVVRVLERGRREVWLAAADSAGAGGMVSVMLSNL